MGTQNIMWPWIRDILNFQSRVHNDINNIFLPDDDNPEDQILLIPTYIEHYSSYLDRIHPQQDHLEYGILDEQGQDNILQEYMAIEYQNKVITLEPSLFDIFRDYLTINPIPSRRHLDLAQPTLSLFLSYNGIVDDSNYFQKYLIQEHGCENSRKNTTSEDILIGGPKSIETQDGIAIVNDIQIQNEAIPAFVCKIVTKYGFGNRRVLNREFVVFLKQASRRLPLRAMVRIWEYCNPYGYFYLEYFSKSMLGAYQLSFRSASVMRKGDIYSLGFKVSVTVLNVFTKKDMVFQKNPYTKRDANQMLIRETRFKSFTVVGYEIENENFFGYKPYHFQCICALEIPLIHVQFELHDQRRKVHYLIFAQEAPYVIGRGHESIINIVAPEISRSQTSLWYDAHLDQWCIRDGVDNLPSVNGSWKCFNAHNHKGTARVTLEHEMIFKVEGACFMVQLPQRKPDKQLAEESNKKVLANTRRFLSF